MAEYIEREALLQALLYLPPKMDEDGYGWLGRRGVWQMVLDFPAADVRPVVFCKDCKWYQIYELKKDGTEDRRYKPSVCVLAEQRRDLNHFCADGKKREES